MERSLPVLAQSNDPSKATCKNACGGCACVSEQDPIPAGNGDAHSNVETGSNILMAEEQVLPTLRRDGSRNWLSPSLAQGFYWHRRRWLAYGLIAFFVTLPHLRISGKPYVLLDIASRQFTFFGHTFYPTDTPLVACLMLMAFFSIMLVTALAGRVWCGWGCPQTVYLEFLFRPIDRFFAGTIGKGGLPRKGMSGPAHVIRFLVYLACCLFLAHTFLSYFVGTDKLAAWIQSSPTKHPVAFLVMGGATLGLLFNFLYFREQFCMIACPYGRFQSVMLDRSSFIVAYDTLRGEPRKRGKRVAAASQSVSSPDANSTQLTLEKVQGQAAGDCIECGRCTAVCPTGIDIRDGLQLECIHCSQCIDACNDIMKKVGKPEGLIRYSSQDALIGKKNHLLRPRTLIYPTIIAIAFGLFLVVLSSKFAFDARVMRMTGAPYTVFQDQHIQNNFRVRLVNRSQLEQEYSIQTSDDAVTARWSNGESIRLSPGGSILAPVDIQFPMSKTAGLGSLDTQLEIQDSSGTKRSISVRLKGPQ
jgi:cytochrome c oxidase accessory protein FixG